MRVEAEALQLLCALTALLLPTALAWLVSCGLRRWCGRAGATATATRSR